MNIAKMPAPIQLSLRKKLNSPTEIAIFAGAYDAVSAMLAEKVGYDGIWASSLAIASTLGHLDDDRYTLSDVLPVTQTLVRVTNVPVIADVGAAWAESGDIANIVEEFERVGAAGICVEETAYPRRNSLYRRPRRLTPAAEFANRIASAIAARINPEFLILARVEALIAGLGETETLNRATAYANAGADAIVIHSTSPTHAEVERVARRWQGSVPLVLIPTKYSGLPIDTFRQLPQVGMLIYANQSLRASMTAIENALCQILSDQNATKAETWIAPVDEVLKLQERFV